VHPATNARRARGANASQAAAAAMPRPRMGRCISGPKAFQRTCKHYKNIDWKSELPDMAKSAVNLPGAAYYANAMGHKFCVAAPGDFVSTPKITEYVAMGAAGGCLPLLVVKGLPERTLPYTRWLDWCKIAYIISDATAKTGMAGVLSKLEAVTAEEATAKRAALLAVRDAFVWRPPTEHPVAQPSAADYLIGELCDAARSAKLNRSLVSSPLAGGPYSRCML